MAEIRGKVFPESSINIGNQFSAIIYSVRVESGELRDYLCSCESTLTPSLGGLFPRLMPNNARSGAKRVLRRNKKISDCVLLGKTQ